MSTPSPALRRPFLCPLIKPVLWPMVSARWVTKKTSRGPSLTSSVDVLRSNLLGFVNQFDETLSWWAPFSCNSSRTYIFIFLPHLHPPPITSLSTHQSSVLHKSSTSNTIESLLLLLPHVLDLSYPQCWPLFLFTASLPRSSCKSPTSLALAWIWNAQDWTFDPASKLLA